MKFKPMLLSVALTVLVSPLAQAQPPVHETPQPEAPAVVGKHHAQSHAAPKASAKSASKKKHKAAKKSGAKKNKKRSTQQAKHHVH